MNRPVRTRKGVIIMAKPFKELIKLMYAEGIDQRCLAKQLGKGTTYVSYRIRGLAPWDMSDVYALCDLFEIPTNEIPVYFPREDITPRTSQV